MDSILQYKEIDVGKIKTSFMIDEELWNDFSAVIVKKMGNRKISLVLEDLIKQYLGRSGGEK